MLLLALLLSPLLRSAGPVMAADPDWFVKKETWVETYLASCDELCRLEREQGIAVPNVKNDPKLPVVLYPEFGRELLDVEVDVDISRVKQLYLGSNRPSRLVEAVLIKTDGSKQPLFENNELTVPHALTDGRGQVTVRGDIEVREAELVLSLDGDFIRLVAKVRVYDTSIFWIDDESHWKAWQGVSRMRDDVRRYAEQVLFEKYEDRDTVEAVKRQLSNVDAGMPSGLRPIPITQAVSQFEAAILQRYGNHVDERVVEALKTTAARVKSEKDFERLVRMGFALSNYHNFQYRKGRSTQTEECPGLADALKDLEKAFFQLDPDTFDYGAGLVAKLEAFDKLVEECKQARELVQIACKTIDYVDPVAPVADDVRTRLAALERELEQNKNSLAAYLGTRDKIRKLRREVLFSHPALDFDQILINRNPPTSYSHNGDQHLGRHSRQGKGLTILSDWKSDHPRVTTPLDGKLPEGAIRNPDLHYDGQKVVFAFCDHTVPSSNSRRFFLYEAAVDGSWVRQLTGTERDPFKTWDDRATVLIEDNDPCYLPDGGLIFISTRGQSFGRCHGGRYNPAWVLHRSDGNGDNIAQLSYNNENEYEPAVLNDGRIVFTRWEYTNRHEMYHHMLWWCRPDGTAISHYYGNDTLFPMMVVEASAIPGTHRVVATAQGHHSYNTGTTVVLDTNLGENDEEPVTHMTPETPYSESSGWPSPHYSHPYAVNEELFLVSRADHRVHSQGQLPPVNDRAIYLVDTMGGRELIYEDPEVASFSPIAIRPRKRPPVLPSMVVENAPPEGTVFVQNAYLTRNDPQRLIKPGMIKALRVNAIGVQPRASRSACSMTVPVEVPKKVLGTVPVGPDGSAFFRAPSGVALQIQTLDENGMAILTEKSFFYLQPGENRSCTGCHEPVGTVSPASLMASGAVRRPVELIPPAGPQYKGGLSFMRTVQPVLDRYCIDCHGLDKTDGGVDLVHDGQQYPISYRALIERGDHRLGLKGYKTKESTISRPFEYYAQSNKVAHLLIEGHGELGSMLGGDRESFLRIIEWLDLNAQCYGDLFPNKIEERRIDSTAMAALRTQVKELFGEKLASQPDRALINAAEPDESRVLMAPLAKDAGGWGQIDAWKSKDDEGYKNVEALVDACIVRSDNENREGWCPSLECGAGENWVMSAREEYRKQFQGEEE